jgi:hypothetical protein
MIFFDLEASWVVQYRKSRFSLAIAGKTEQHCMFRVGIFCALYYRCCAFIFLLVEEPKFCIAKWAYGYDLYYRTAACRSSPCSNVATRFELLFGFISPYATTRQ